MKGVTSLLCNVLGIALGVVIGLFVFNYIQRVRAEPKFVSMDVATKLRGSDVSPPFIIVKKGCPFCEAAEKFVSANKINMRYLSIDDEKDRTKTVMDALGTDSFPTLVLKNRILVGFDQTLYEEAKASMRGNKPQ